MSKSAFVFDENSQLIACVGANGGTDDYIIQRGFVSAVELLYEGISNGESEDTLIYPLSYCIRHSIELSLKIILNFIKTLHSYKNIPTPQELREIYTHDFFKLNSIIKDLYTIDRRIPPLYNPCEDYLKDFYFDHTNEAFRYSTNHEEKPILEFQKITHIPIDILKENFDNLITILNHLINELEIMIEEYKVKTFTKELSRQDLKDISKLLPARENWGNTEFNEIKTKIISQYKLSNNEFSKALKLIESHPEFSININIEHLFKSIPIDDLLTYATLVFESNKYKEYKCKSENSSQWLFVSLPEQTKHLLSILQNISNTTLNILMAFRDITRNNQFSDSLESNYQYIHSSNFNNHYFLNTLKKLQTCNYILIAMKQCGQKTYYNTLLQKLHEYNLFMDMDLMP